MKVVLSGITRCAAQTTALEVSSPNPHVLRGALVEFPAFSDAFDDVRTSNDTRVSIDNNAGAVSALAGLHVASGSWDQCLQVRCPVVDLEGLWSCKLSCWPIK